MKIKSLMLLVVAVGFGLVAMLGAQEVLSSNQAEQPMTDVLVATVDIDPGTTVDETNTEFRQWPSDKVPEGAVTNLEEIDGRALRMPAVPGEVIMKAKLAEEGFLPSSEIPEGLRVVTVPVDDTKSHHGQLRPGDRVDVLVTYKARSENGTISRTKTVLQFIQVFATGSVRHTTTAEAEVDAKTISLLVTPDQASLLMLSQSKGVLHLALRNPGDKESANTVTYDERIFDDDLNTAAPPDTSRRADDDRVMYPDKDKEEEIRARLLAELEQQKQLKLQDETAAEPQGAEPAETENPMWRMVIYAGDERRVEEVELPQDEPPADPGAAQKVKGFFQKLFEFGA